MAPIVFLIGQLLWLRPLAPANQDIEQSSNENIPVVPSSLKEYIAVSGPKSKNEEADPVDDASISTRPPSYHIVDGDEASSLEVGPVKP